MRKMTSASVMRAAASSVAISLMLAQPTLAQDEAAGVRSADEDIVVTARRRAESIQSVPVSVQAFSGETLVKQNVRSTVDLQRITPGVVFNGSGSDFNTTLTIRGQGRATIGTISPSVQSYVNEVPLPSWGAVIPTYDVANVQVLKGPQGTLFGRNTVGGAVLIYSKAPTHDIGGYGSISYGNFDARELEAAVNVPVVQDKVALRIAGQYRKRDGYTKGGYDYLPDGNNVNSRAFRVSLLVEPVDGLRNTTVYDYYHTYMHAVQVMTDYSAGTNNGAFSAFRFLGGAIYGQPGLFDCGTSAACDPDLALARAKADKYRRYYSAMVPFSRATVQGITNTTSLDIGDVTVKNILAFRKNRIHESSDTDAMELKFVDAFNVRRADDQLSNELQVSGRLFDGSLNWLAGGFYLRNKPEGPNAIGFALIEPNGVPLGTGPLSVIGDQQPLETTKAIFGSLSQNLDGILPGLKLNASGRYTWDDISVCSITRAPATLKELGSYDDCQGTPGATTAKGSFEKFTWALGMDYQATSKLFFYAVARRGYRAGGVNTPVLGGTLVSLQSFQPQIITDGEIGVKADWNVGDVRGRINVSGFISKFKGLQLNASGLGPDVDGDGNPLNDPTNTSLILNAGNAKTRGIELDGFVEPVENLRLGYGLSLFHGRIKYDIPVVANGLIDTTSDTFNNAPKTTYTLSADYTVPNVGGGDLNFNINYYKMSGFRTDLAINSGYGLLNGSISLSNIGETGVSATIFGQNLTNERYLLNPNASGATPGYQTWTPGPPRMYGVRLSYKFGAE